MVGINRAGQGNGGDGATYIPVPAKTWRMEILTATYKVSNRADWSDQISFCVGVAAQDKARLAKSAPKLGEGEQQGDRAWANFGATLNGFKGENYTPTKLANFISALFGSEQQTMVQQWIKDGGGWPDMDSEDVEVLNEGLKWFVGLQFFGTVTHGTPNAEGRIWPKIASAVPIGDREADPEYEAFGHGKFHQILEQTGASLPDLPEEDAPAYSAKGEPINKETGEIGPASSDEDEEAALMRQLEEARKRKAAQAQATLAKVRDGNTAAQVQTAAKAQKEHDLSTQEGIDAAYDATFGQEAQGAA